MVSLRAADAPGTSCDAGEVSAPTSVNIKMEDDDGDVLIDGSKTVVCSHGQRTSLKRDVFFQGPLNCKDSAVPASGFTNGDITATVSINDVAVYEEIHNLKCFR